MFAATERVRTCLYWLVSDNVNSLTSPLLRLECLLTSAACFCLHKLGEILIELVRKCEELYDMSNKYSDSVWKGKLWGPTGEELKKNQGKFQCFIYCAFWSYRIFSNLIRTSFCLFLKRKKKKFAVLTASFLQPPLAYKADWIILDVTNALTVIRCISNALDGSEDHIQWEDDGEGKDDSDWVTDSDSVMSDDGESDEW